MFADAERSPAQLARRIRAKIEERRVLEARFLLRQVRDEIDVGQRTQLEQELGRILAEVERLRHQARSVVAEGRLAEAAQCYRDLERLAVDVPGLAEERQALAGAETLLARMAARGSNEGRLPEGEGDSPGQAVVADAELQPAPVLTGAEADGTSPEEILGRPGAQPLQSGLGQGGARLLSCGMRSVKAGFATGRTKVVLWWASARAACATARRIRLPGRLPHPWRLGLAGVVLVVALLLLWQSHAPAPSPAPAANPVLASPPMPDKTSAPTDVAPEPAMPASPPQQPLPVTVEPPPEPAPQPAAPPAMADPPPSAVEQAEPPSDEKPAKAPTFKLGTLQVEDAGRK